MRVIVVDPLPDHATVSIGFAAVRIQSIVRKSIEHIRNNRTKLVDTTQRIELINVITVSAKN